MAGVTAVIPSLAYQIYDVSPANIVDIIVVCSVLVLGLPLGIWLWWHYWFKRKSASLLTDSAQQLLGTMKRWAWMLVILTTVGVGLVWLTLFQDLSYVLCGIHLLMGVVFFFWMKKLKLARGSRNLPLVLLGTAVIGCVIQILIHNADKHYDFKIIEHEKINDLVAAEIELQREMGADNANLIHRFEVLGMIREMELHKDPSVTRHPRHDHVNAAAEADSKIDSAILLIDELKFLYEGSFEELDSAELITKNIMGLTTYVSDISRLLEAGTNELEFELDYRELYQNHYLPFLKLSNQYAKEGSERASKVVNTLLHRIRNVGVTIYILIFTAFACMFMMLRSHFEIKEAEEEALEAKPDKKREADADDEEEKEEQLSPELTALEEFKTQVRFGMIMVFLLLIPMFNSSLAVKADLSNPDSMFSLLPSPDENYTPLGGLEESPPVELPPAGATPEQSDLKDELRELTDVVDALSRKVDGLGVESRDTIIKEINSVHGSFNDRLDRVDERLGIEPSNQQP